MISTRSDRYVGACSSCKSSVVFCDVIRTYVDWTGKWVMIMYAPYMINLDTLLCPDCEHTTAPSEEYLNVLLDGAPAHDDDSNYVIINHYRGK